MPAPPDLNGCSLTYNDIRYKIGEKEILFGISGEVRAGEFLAIMGPSGLIAILSLKAIQSKT